MFLHTFRASKSFTIFVVCTAVFADILLQNLVVPVLPYALRERVGLTDEGDVQRWSSILLAAFGGAFMGGSFLFGTLVDQLPSLRTPFLLGLSLTFTATIGLGLATTLPVLLIARLSEGLSTAVIATVGSVLLRRVVGQKTLGRAMGYTSMALTLGLLLGPVVGGVLYEYCGYFETFLPAIALVGVEIGLRVLLVEPKRGTMALSRLGRVDEEEALPAAERTRIRDGQTEGAAAGPASRSSSSSQDTDSLRSPSPSSSTHHLITDSRSPSSTTTAPTPPSFNTETSPLLPPPKDSPLTPQPKHPLLLLLLHPPFTTPLLMLFLINTIACGFDATLPPFLSSTYALTPIHIATLFLSLALPQLFSPLAGALTDRYGARRVACVGMVWYTLALGVLAVFDEETGEPVMVKLCAAFVNVGAAMAVVGVPLRVAASDAVAFLERRWSGVFGEGGAQGRGFGIITGAVAAGGMVGPLVAGWLRVGMGWRGMVVVMVVASAGLGVGIVWVVPRRGEEEMAVGDGEGER